MNSHWFSMVTLLAALALGYNVLVNRDSDSISHAPEQSMLMGYYLKDAVITETSETGSPHLRFAASDVLQNTSDDSIKFSAVRIDYVWPTKRQSATDANHWVLNADEALLPNQAQTPKQRTNSHTKQTSSQTSDKTNAAANNERIELRGNVEAHSVDAQHEASIKTQSLDIDTRDQVAHSNEPVVIDVDGHTVKGHGLLADMQRNRMQLKSDVSMRLAAAQIKNTDPATTKASAAAAISLPNFFESDGFDLTNNVFTLTKVRSKSEPFISADQAQSSGDVANNQWHLRGHIRLDLPKRGLLTADNATINIRNSRMVRAQVIGAPVHFQHQRKDSEQMVNGHAANIDYDVATQTVQLTGGAWFSNGEIEFSADFIEYNLATEAARGTHGSGGPVKRPDTSTAEPTSP